MLYTHPAVRECAVIGLPDPLLGEQVCACVVLKDGADVAPETLITHCRAQLAKYKTPARVELMRMFRRNAVGKVLKRDLRAQLTRSAASALTEPALSP